MEKRKKKKKENLLLFALQKLLGENAVTFEHILPHFMKADMVIALDDNNKPLPVRDILPNHMGIKYIPEGYKKNVKWFVIIAGTNYTCIMDTCTSVGYFSTKIRQLRRIGYIPILV